MAHLRTFVILSFCFVICFVKVKSSPIDIEEKEAIVFREFRNETDLFWKDYSLEEIKSKQSELMQSYINPSINPCDDYFEYACGNGFKYNSFSIEDTYSGARFTRYGKFMFNAARAINLLHEQYEDNKDENSAEGKLKMFYASCINENIKNDKKQAVWKYVPEVYDNPCFEVVETNFYPLLGAFFIKNYFDKTSEETIKRVSTDIKNTLLYDVSQVKWLPNDDKEAITKYLTEVEVKSGIELFSDEKFNEIYSDLKVIPNYYSKNLLYVKEFNSNRTFKEYNYNEGLAYYYQGKIDKKLINLPIFDLQPPNFHQNFPNAILFGSVGTEMLHHYIAALLFIDLKDRKTDLKTCLKNQIDAYGKDAFDDYRFGFPEDAVSDKLFIEYFTINKSFNSYVKLLEKSYNSEDEKLPGLDVNPKQLFFLSYAQNRCTWKNGKLDKSQNMFLVNFEKFAEVYSCPIGSGMNPEKKCKFQWT